ncbi:MAG: hypothetical protein VX589_07270 [Myxococcota bacterium]|nr:hypothetical protein [Myxococcota bacterium]
MTNARRKPLRTAPRFTAIDENPSLKSEHVERLGAVPKPGLACALYPRRDDRYFKTVSDGPVRCACVAISRTTFLFTPPRSSSSVSVSA